jgi:hypothetical protein
MLKLGVSTQFFVAVGLSRFCYVSQTELESMRSSSIARLQSASLSPPMKDSSRTSSTNVDIINTSFSTEKKSPYSSMEHNLSESSSDTYSDSSRDQSAPGDDEILLLPPLQIYSDSSRDQSVPRDNEPWSLGVRQRVTS